MGLGGVPVRYRPISPPAGMSGFTTTADWLEWARAQRLVADIAPRLEGACCTCYGSVGYDIDGAPWQQCFNCRKYATQGISLSPISYSIDAGSESLLHRYKDWPNYRWASQPLASLLSTFLLKHRACIEGIAECGRLGTAMMVPSGNDARAWKHMDGLVASVNKWPVDWQMDAISKVKPGRVARGHCDPSYYRVDADVRAQSVLLVDDTWTSGASTISSAWALRAAGARHVAIVTLGRQLNRAGPGSSAALVDAIQGRGFDESRCVRCA
jgi:predicted amidophosphoribosyltransferase